MDERIESAIRDVLRPLLEADGGGVEFVAAEDTTITLRLSGKAAYSVGGRYIRTLVIEPLLRKVTGQTDLKVVLEDAVSRPRSQELDVGEVVSQIRRQEAQHGATPAANAEPDEAAPSGASQASEESNDADGADDAAEAPNEPDDAS